MSINFKYLAKIIIFLVNNKAILVSRARYIKSRQKKQRKLQTS